MEVAKRPWVWKDPALCHYLPFWMQVWTDPVVVVCTRHPIDIAVSWRHFCSAEGVSTSVACNLMRWQHMLRSVLIGTKAVTDKLFVSYEALISGRTSEIDRLVAFLDTALDRDTPVAKRLEMDEVVDPSLRRVATNGECLTSVMCDSQADLFALLQRKVVDASAPFSEQDYPMPTRWRTDVLAQEAAIREL
jgi:hypothetical protein